MDKINLGYAKEDLSGRVVLIVIDFFKGEFLLFGNQ